MASGEITFDVRLTDRGLELMSRLKRLRNQAVHGNRAKSRRLMRKGIAIIKRYFRDADVLRLEAAT